jgi:hypothetical protein
MVACRCFREKKWSVTVRLEKPLSQNLAVPKQAPQPQASNFKCDKPQSDFLCSLGQTLKTILNAIPPEPRTGVIVVTGATASGKSEIARGIIDERMQRARSSSGRRPHLITFEDPIEKFYVKNDNEAQPNDFDNTPREKRVDAPDLSSVFRDALRQTPTLVFVGEIRESKEWADVIDFASTGHSVIATAHAGSLAEAWGKILSAVGARSPAQRSDVADRVLAIVHLRSLPGIKGSIPALWRYTAAGAKALMADGRGSLVPLRSAGPLDEVRHSSFGRAWFIESLDLDPGSKELKAAFRSDLEGL